MFSHRRNLSQTVLIAKINTYFSSIRYPLELNAPGCCHGLTILWLKRMAQGRANDMLEIIERIIYQPADRMHEMDAEIKKFARCIDKKQRPENYSSNASQEDLDIILKVNEQEILDGTYLSRDLAHFFNQLPTQGSMILITHMNSFFSEAKGKHFRHTVGLYIGQGLFNVYDANYRTGHEKCFSNASDAAIEIRSCLFHTCDLRAPAFMPLKIKMVQANQLARKLKMG